ncbi:hypothetical protein V6N11_015326 [Hibiscus sabdariffa]|uniref:aminobutyraldehyde dehydrogenase n=1 Tax=Hibiscus sabdariffa TaxID=183260 RepID=A0ABR2TS89_9ROSI
MDKNMVLIHCEKAHIDAGEGGRKLKRESLNLPNLKQLIVGNPLKNQKLTWMMLSVALSTMQTLQNLPNMCFLDKSSLEDIVLNYPLLMAIWKVALALAAGCAAILKPSELSSVTCLELGEVCREVDLPAGVLNILPGLGPEAGAPLACHPHVDKLPTIITDVNTSMQIWREEVFEPVLCIKTFTSEEEATELTNDTHYGLGGAVVSKDIERYDRALQLGAVWANCSQPCSMVWLWNGIYPNL